MKWSDNPNVGVRFNQTGYSAKTLFPVQSNYTNPTNYLKDLALAIAREESHLEWLWGQYQEAKLEYEIAQAETKALREDY